ncbi:MAG TPA: hypothetical protein VIL65_07570 [Beijerinckiaceae bacterium]|jgi:hypothetical protein
MRVFLLSCLGVALIAAAAYAILEGGFARNAGDAFARAGSTRVSDEYKPDPAGYLSHVQAPAGGKTSGRSQTSETAPPVRQ